jgi:hypothetical protein
MGRATSVEIAQKRFGPRERSEKTNKKLNVCDPNLVASTEKDDHVFFTGVQFFLKIFLKKFCWAMDLLFGEENGYEYLFGGRVFRFRSRDKAHRCENGSCYQFQAHFPRRFSSKSKDER